MWAYYSIHLYLLHLVLLLSNTLLIYMSSVTKYIVIIFALNSIISFKHVKNKQNKKRILWKLKKLWRWMVVMWMYLVWVHSMNVLNTTDLYT